MRESPESPDREATESEFLGELFDEIAERLQAGDEFEFDSYLQRYPERAEQIGRLMPTLDLLAGTQSLRSADSTDWQESAAELSVDSEPDTIERMLGDFRISREVGRGGMGVVYEAEQLSLGRKVALKVLPFASVFDKRQIKRFQKEAQAAAQLHHQHIVPVFAVGCERGVHYYAMQFIQGRTLAAVIQELRENDGYFSPGQSPRSHSLSSPQVPLHAGLSPSNPTPGLTAMSTSSRGFVRAVAEVGIQAAEALAYAHEAGVIHRDIKPGNILVDDGGKIWITDFGLARFQGDASLTVSGDLVGTLRYMSPEQALAKRVEIDERTDVYSLGVTLYELLTLERAIGGESREEVLRNISFAEPTGLRRVRPSIPTEIETIVLKAIEKDPSERYAGAAQLAEDLRAYLDHKPISARRPTTVQRVVKWSRRHRSLVASVAVSSLLALVLVTIGAVVLAIHLDREMTEVTKRAEENRDEARRNEEQAQTNAMLAEGRSQQLVRSYVANGSRQFEGGNVTGALAWFTAALDLDRGDPDREAPHRIRIAATLERAPHLRRVWFDADAKVLALDRWGHRRLMQASDGWTLQHDAGSPISSEPGQLRGGVFSADGSHMLTSGTARARIWQTTSGEETAALELGSEPIERPCFSPDGRRIAAWIPGGGAVGVWDVESGRPVGDPVEVPGARSFPLTFSPDGRWLAIPAPRRVEVRDVETGTSIIPQGRTLLHKNNVVKLAFHPRGEWLASSSTDGTVQLWSTETWDRILLLDHPGIPNNIDVSPDGRWIASTCLDGFVRVWSALDGQVLYRKRMSHRRLTALQFSPDGRQLLVAIQVLGVTVLWNYFDDSMLELRGGQRLTESWFSPDGRYVFARHSRYLACWEIPRRPRLLPPLVGSRSYLSGVSNVRRRLVSVKHPDGGVRYFDRFLVQALNEPRSGSAHVWTASFSPDGRLVATAGIDGTARVWDATTFLPLTPPLHHPDAILHCTFSPDGRWLVTVSPRQTHTWHVATGDAGPIRLTNTMAASFSSDSRLLAVAGTDRTVRVWKTETGEPVGSPLVHERSATRVLFTPDGRYLVTGTRAASVVVWDLKTGSLLHRLGDAWSTRIALDPEGQRVLAALSGRGAGRLVIWDIATGEELRVSSVAHGCCEAASWSPDGSSFVSAGVDQRLVFTDAASGDATLKVAQPNVLFDTCFSPDGRWVLTASFDGDARLWDARTGEWVTPVFHHDGPLLDAKFSPQGDRILTASHIGRVIRVPRETRSVDDLVDVARLLAGRQVDPQTNRLEPLDEDLRAVYERVRTKHPAAFADSKERDLAWHRARAEEELKGARWGDAVAHLDELIEAEPTYYPTVVARGHALAELGRWQEAAGAFDHALKLGETDPWIEHCCALAWLAAGDVSGVRESVERMLARSERVPSAGRLRWLAWTCALAPEAVRDLEPVLQRVASLPENEDPDDRFVTLCLAALRFRTGNDNAAITLFSELTKAKVPIATQRIAGFFLGLVELSRGDRDASRAAIEAATAREIGQSSWSVREAARRIEEEARSALAALGE